MLVAYWVPAGAQTEAETIRSILREGQKVSVTDDGGRELDGRIVSLGVSTLSLQHDRTKQTEIPYGDVLRIDRPRDGLSNGALIGLGVGAAFGLTAWAVDRDPGPCDPDGWWECSPPGTTEYVAATLVTAGLGAAIGVGVDALIRRERNLYRRGQATRITLVPTLAAYVRGVSVSISW
jgi:hypothetical protein